MSNHAKMTWITPCMGAFLLLLAGCGEKTGTVSGTATYNGNPITTGSIDFNMKGKGIAQDGRLDSSGRYSMPEPMPVGTYHVCYAPPQAEPQDPKTAKPLVTKATVPQKFRDLQSTPVTVEVKPGKNVIAIEFKD